jgi:two-component sensor histidine kinase
MVVIFVAGLRVAIQRNRELSQRLEQHGLALRERPDDPLRLQKIVRESNADALFERMWLASKIGRDITDRKRSEAQISVLAREAEHRAKNLLANVGAMVDLSQSDTTEGLKEAIKGRIEALASVHSLFAQTRWAGAELGSLVKQELSPYSRDAETRTRVHGPPVMLKPDVAQAIAVALHELATNATKYGAISVAPGQVRLEWMSNDAAQARLSGHHIGYWKEAVLDENLTLQWAPKRIFGVDAR